jgi:hypothetical protein
MSERRVSSNICAQLAGSFVRALMPYPLARQRCSARQVRDVRALVAGEGSTIMQPSQEAPPPSSPQTAQYEQQLDTQIAQQEPGALNVADLKEDMRAALDAIHSDPVLTARFQRRLNDERHASLDAPRAIKNFVEVAAGTMGTYVPSSEVVDVTSGPWLLDRAAAPP